MFSKISLSKKSVIISVFVCACLAVAQLSFATEPVDNNKPTGVLLWYGAAYVLECGASGNGCGFAQESIGSNTDKDYFMVVCGQSKVQNVGITMVGGSGFNDLDIKVYKPNNDYIGGSAGTGTTESVYTGGANLNAVVLEVYGYNGSMTSYTPNVTCY